MRKIRKITALALCLMVATALLVGLAGCGEKDAVGEAGAPYLGTWMASKAVYEGIELDADDALGGTFLFILNKDGTAHVQVDTDRELAKWRPSENGIVLIEGDDEYDMVASGSDLMVWNYQGVDIYIERYTEEEQQ